MAARWRLCKQHEQALRRYQSARFTWTLTRKDPEPEARKEALFDKIRKRVRGCKECRCDVTT